MSAATATAEATAAAARPPLSRLTTVELRKAIDTRAGFWLLLTIVLLTVLVLVLLAATSDDWDVQDAFSLALAPSSFLLPIVGILLVTSEFSQRTALTTFTLVPARGRIALAKLAALVLAAGATAICVVAALVTAAVGGGHGSAGAGVLGEALVFELLTIAMGFAFGILLLNSPLAIVLSFLVPIGWSVLVQTVHSLHGVAAWLDTSESWNPLMDDGAPHWARVAASAALWVVLPVALGTARLLRSDVH